MEMEYLKDLCLTRHAQNVNAARKICHVALTFRACAAISCGLGLSCGPCSCDFNTARCVRRRVPGENYFYLNIKV